MTSRRHLTLVAAAATLFAAAPIVTIFDSLSWLFRAIVIVALISGAAWGARSMRSRLWAQVLAMLGALIIALTMFFSEGTALVGIIPTPATFAKFAELFALSGQEVRTAYVPAPDLRGLLFITALGIGLVAIFVDTFAVGLRRPALAGLPMLAIYSVPVAVYVESVSPIPFMIGAVGFLWLLVTDNVDKVRRFGRRFTGEGRGVDLWEPSPLAAAGRRLAVFGVAVAVILPVVVPGMTAGFFSQFGTTGQGPGNGRFGSGGSSVNLFAHLYGELNQTQVRELVRVTTNDPSPFYLRFGVADEIQLDGFKNRAPNGRPVGNELPRPIGLTAPGVTTQQFTAKVEVFKVFDMPMVPVYSAPISTKGLDTSWSYDVDQQVVFSQRSSSAGRKYDFDYIRPEFTPEALRTAKPLPISNSIQRNFGRVPVELPAVRKQVDELIGGKSTVYDQVRALYDFFSQKNNFVYDLTVPEGTSGQKITDFLEVRRGFCQQYAAALAWMVRAAGIPARVAFGFTKGSNYTSGTYTLTNRNLHAWTEVYFDGFGWVPFDATPSASVAGAVNSAWAPNVDAPPESTPTGGPISPGPTVNPEDERPGRTNDPFCPECEVPGSSTTTPTPPWVWWSGGAVLLLILLFTLPALRRQSLRRLRRRVSALPVASAPQDGSPELAMTVVADDGGEGARLQAHAAWDELIDTMIDYRIVIDPAETPRSTAERLVHQEGLPTPVAEQTRRLSHAEERARYSKQPLSSTGLMAAVAEVRRTLASQAGRWVRISAVLMPPSVVQRWRNRATQLSARFSQKTLDFSLAMRRFTRPLRLRRLTR
ncbi:MAG TPA: transglutaminase [Micromonosporaceae bacterium]|nr:transglutaminase [Micromonosporaceae bacterium]